MIAYLIIGIELVILYGIFWVVFLREPRPREIRAELWGEYGNTPESLAEKPTAPAYLYIYDDGQIKSHPDHVPKLRFYETARIRRGRRAIRHVSSNRRRSRQGRMMETKRARQEMINRNMAEKFLLTLSRFLNQLSVKTP